MATAIITDLNRCVGCLACAVIVLVCALVARKKAGASKTYLVVAAVAALATSLFFRVAVYQLGFSVFMLY